MADHLDSALDALASGPVPALADPEAVRRRGDQRRRRARTLLAATCAVAVLAAGAVAAVAADRAGRPDTLVPARTPTATPTDSFTAAVDVVVPAVHEAALLTAADARSATGGTWSASQPVDDPVMGLLPCPTGDGYAGSGLSRTLRLGTTEVRQTVVLVSAGSAPAWARALREEVRDCPRGTADSEDGKASDSYALLEPPPGRAADTAVVRDTYRDCDTCPGTVTLWVVVGAGDLLSYLALPPGELDRVGAWADATRARLLVDPPVVAGNPLDGTSRVDDASFGHLVFGMTVTEAESVLGQAFQRSASDGAGCRYTRLRSALAEVRFMVVGAEVVRVDVDGGPTRTYEGVGLGSTEEEVTRAFGPDRVEVQPDPLSDGHLLRVRTLDGRHALLFETDGARVLRFRAGLLDAVSRVEGCLGGD